MSIKSNKKILIVLIIAVIIILGVILLPPLLFKSNCIQPNCPPVPVPLKLSEFKCKILGGTVVNTLDYYDEVLDKIVYPSTGVCNGKNLLGEITGLRCPCVCCK